MPVRLAAATLLLMSIAGEPGAAETQRLAVIDPKQDEAAVAKLRPLAEAGDPDAQLSLGIAYDLGRGVPPDPMMACDWYARAGDAGLGAAEFDRAAMQDSGRCGPRDPALTALWYARAAAHGHARAQYDLALLYASGDGVPRNMQLARAWATVAAANGISAQMPGVGAAAVAPPSTDMRMATALWPRETVAETANGAPIPLVWTSAEQPDGTEFTVEIYATGPVPPVLVATDATSRSTALAQLKPGEYSWRVLAANAATRHYVAGDWTPFRVTPRTLSGARD